MSAGFVKSHPEISNARGYACPTRKEGLSTGTAAIHCRLSFHASIHAARDFIRHMLVQFVASGEEQVMSDTLLGVKPRFSLFRVIRVAPTMAMNGKGSPGDIRSTPTACKNRMELVVAQLTGG